jgi:phage tail-like protein
VSDDDVPDPPDGPDGPEGPSGDGGDPSGPDGGDGYATAQGASELADLFLTGPGFGTVRFAGHIGSRPAPPAASARRIMRERLPGIYQDQDFSMRFIGALEEVLDPIVGLLDALPEHFRADLAPADILELVTGWLGIELNESQPTFERREVVRRAAELGRRRGTRRGLELALSLGFPALPFRVEDGGGVVYATDPAKLTEAPAPSFIVYCDQPIPEDRQAAVARLIEQVKPAHVRYKLRVKAAKKRPA